MTDPRCHAGRCARMSPGLCDRCASRLADQLSDLPGLVATLADDRPEPCCPDHATAPLPAGTVRVKTGQRVSGSAETPLPGGADRLSWLAQAADVHDADNSDCQTGAVPVASALCSWARLVAEERGITPPNAGSFVLGRLGPVLRVSSGDLGGLVTYLQRHHEWATRQPWADEYAVEVHEVWSRARAMAGVGEKLRRLGPCPTPDPDTGKVCGAVLWADPYADAIACRSCRSEWPRSRWLWLGGMLRAEAV